MNQVLGILRNLQVEIDPVLPKVLFEEIVSSPGFVTGTTQGRLIKVNKTWQRWLLTTVRAEHQTDAEELPDQSAVWPSSL